MDIAEQKKTSFGLTWIAFSDRVEGRAGSDGSQDVDEKHERVHDDCSERTKMFRIKNVKLHSTSIQCY